MHLNQFDKLQQLLNRLEERVMYLKQHNYRLIQENAQLKQELAEVKNNHPTAEYNKKLNALIEENKRLKANNQQANLKLNALIEEVGQTLAQQNGVEH
ncbi:MAG: hypothetical protein D6677_10725 [Calditrichaeota bacterium]|nr:MAG: hypothetical protein D6677_10725 [Calditrichota bacterium]